MAIWVIPVLALGSWILVARDGLSLGLTASFDLVLCLPVAFIIWVQLVVESIVGIEAKPDGVWLYGRALRPGGRIRTCIDWDGVDEVAWRGRRGTLVSTSKGVFLLTTAQVRAWLGDARFRASKPLPPEVVQLIRASLA